MRALLWSALLASCATAPSPLASYPVALRIRNDSGVIDLASLRGKVVVVTLISTWAGPALIETELYRSLHQRYAGELQIVTIVMERPEMVQIFQEQFALPYLVGWVDDPAALTSADGPFGEITLIPTSILLDREGRIAARMDGTWAPAVLEEAIQRLLAP